MRCKYFVVDRNVGRLKGSGFTSDFDVKVDVISNEQSTIQLNESGYEYGDLIYLSSGVYSGANPALPFFFAGSIETFDEENFEATAREFRSTLNDDNPSGNFWNIDTYKSWERAIFQTMLITSQPAEIPGKQLGMVSILPPNTYTTTTSPNNNRWDKSKESTEFVIIGGNEMLEAWFNRFNIGLYFVGFDSGLDPSGNVAYLSKFAFQNRFNMTEEYPTLQIKNNVDDLFRDWSISERAFDSTTKNGIIIRNKTGSGSIPVEFYQRNDGTIVDDYMDEGVTKPVNYTTVFRDDYGDDLPSDRNIAADKLTNSSFNHVIEVTTDIDNRMLNGGSGTIWNNVNIGQRWNVYYNGTKYETVLTGYSLSGDSDEITLTFGKTRNKISYLLGVK